MAQWVTGQGFTITDSSLSRRFIQFTGTVAQAEQSFGTTEMVFGHGDYYSNQTEPRIPARFDGVIGAIIGLDNNSGDFCGRGARGQGRSRSPAGAFQRCAHLGVAVRLGAGG